MVEKIAAEKALDDIAAICGCPAWEYPGQVVRDVTAVVETLRALVVLIDTAPDCNVSWLKVRLRKLTLAKIMLERSSLAEQAAPGNREAERG